MSLFDRLVDVILMDHAADNRMHLKFLLSELSNYVDRQKHLTENQKLSRAFPALVLTGARQAGKTSLLRKLFPDYTYVSLDIPSTAELANYSPDEFISRYTLPLLVDEV